MHIYYINLARRTDRRAMIEAELARVGLVAERIEATTPADLPAADVARYCDPRRHRFVSQAELSCSFSHIAAMRRLLASGEPHALILEDDALLSHRLPALLAAYDAAPPVWLDLFRIETDEIPARLAPHADGAIGEIDLYRYYFAAVGCAGYIVTRSAALRLVDDEAIRFQPVDVFFNTYTRVARRFSVRQAVPALVMQRDRLADSGIRREHESDIYPGFAERYEQSERELAWRRLPFQIADFVTRDIVAGSIKTVRQHLLGARKRLIPFEPAARMEPPATEQPGTSATVSELGG